MNDIDLKEKYRNFYDEHVIKEIEKFNTQRKTFRNLTIILHITVAGMMCLFLALICSILSSYFAYFDIIAPVLGIFAFITLTASMLIMHFIYPNMTNFSQIDPEAEIKSKLMPNFMKLFGDFSWRKKTDTLVLDYNKLQQTRIIPNNISFVGDDCITGNYENVGINVTEMCIGKMALLMYIVILFICFAFFYFLMGLFVIPFTTLVFMGIAQFIHIYVAFALLALAICFCLFWLSKILYKIFAHFLTVGRFRGVMIELDMPKKFSGHTFLFENAFSAGAIKRKRKNGYEKVILEDNEFNKTWSIYSNDQQEARYVLTPAFMERLKNISFAFKAKYLRMSFKNSKMTILAASSKDLFIMGNVFKNTDKKTFDTLFNEIYSVIQLIDELKLKNKYTLK